MSAFLVLVWAVCAVLGLFVGNAKGRPGLGLALGLFFGVIGVVIVAVLAPTPEAAQARERAQ